ncbi:sodium:solute symporter family transporter, partial [Acinetobacter baumannii]|uniref:sodium:solute symporter family transporter n=2 Tax=Pseudomonadota TaxID=1224 RepID=UPI00227A1C9D
EHQLVTVGRIAAVVAVIIGILTARPLLGGFDQAFQFIQEFTGFFTPGIVVIFMLGLFWKRASEAGALTAAIGSVVLSAVFWWLQETGQFIFPFMNRVAVVFVVSLIAAVIVSLLVPAKPDAMKIKLDKISYKTSLGFNLAGVGVIAFLILVYWIWW